MARVSPEGNHPLDPERLRELWDFGDPAGSEQRFRDECGFHHQNSLARAELSTQLARAIGLQGRFGDADLLLDDMTHQSPLARTRIALERGRLRNSSGDPHAAIPLFALALQQAELAKNDDLALDAIHMLAIADIERAAAWFDKGNALAARTSDPSGRRWTGSLLNNHGWTLHDAGRLDDALDVFQRALSAYEADSVPERIHIAHWTVAHCLRSLGRDTEALAIQTRLKANDPPDPYVDEEIAILAGSSQGPASAESPAAGKTS